MQQNSAEFPSKLSRPCENVIQSTSTNSTHIPRPSNNPRFAITPETLGMNVRSETSGTSRLHPRPAVDVKSYNERHSNHSVGLLADCKPESSACFQSSHMNTPTHSLRGGSADRADLMLQSPSPTSSPQIPQQQWNFQHITHNENLQQNAEESSKTSCQSLGNTSAAAHDQGGLFQNSTSIKEVQMQYHDFCSNESAKLNFQNINGIYAKRIEDIDANACGDRDLKVFTYQEWVDLLIKINEGFLIDIEELEREVAARLELMQRRVNSNCRHSQGNELMKCRKDINTLLRYIKNTNSDKNRDFLHGLTLETLTPDEVLYMLDVDNLTIEDSNRSDEIKNYNDTDAVQRNKLYANMKALALEVAEKHDEIRELKRQVICLEDEIQKAQKKIQLKDDVIKELRNDLKCANNNKIPSNPPSEMSDLENQIPCSASTPITDNTSAFQIENSCQFESLSHSELEEQDKIKILQDELSDLFEISDLNKQKIDQHHKKIKDVITKLVSEKLEAYSKLDYIRQQLIHLECEFSEGKSDCDSGFRSNSENDQNTKLVDAIRQRLRRRNDMICELKKKVQQLELDKKELSTRLETEKSFSSRSSGVLKEVADLLCNLRGKQFSYTDIYNTGPGQMNPFCEAIVEMQNDFKEKEAQLLQDKENDELSQLVLQRKKELNQEIAQNSNLNNFEDINKALLSCTPTTSQLPPTLAPRVTKTSATSSTAHSNHTTYQ